MRAECKRRLVRRAPQGRRQGHSKKTQHPAWQIASHLKLQFPSYRAVACATCNRLRSDQGLPCVQSGGGRETADAGTKILRPCFTRIEIELRLSRFAAGSRSSTRKLAS